jgi:2-polyprenyl-3-methyl-5-hydroxy-6-metoxy-1,4-benzoquinol methylase
LTEQMTSPGGRTLLAMSNDGSIEAPSTAETAYAQRLQHLAKRGGVLRRVIDPQRPYRWNLRRLRPGLMLDIGCGIGRNLLHNDGKGVGVDHNADCIAACRDLGLTAYTTDEFASSPDAVHGRFDSLLFAHVLEHMTAPEADELLASYLPYLRTNGKIIVITPQERGQASDETHVMFVDEAAIRKMADRLHLRPIIIRSFPFTRAFGKIFTYNETVAVLSPGRAE